MRVLLAYSGGLDTSYLVAWLVRERGAEVVAATVDCGGFSEAERRAIRSRALALGAADHRFYDARTELVERVLRHLVAANVRRGGVYPLSVAAERSLQAERLAFVALEEGFDALAHGCTAAGNDQVRFEAALHAVAPGLAVLAPVRDLAPSRDEQRAYLSSVGAPMPPKGSTYSINAGLWGLTIGGGAMLGTAEPLPEEAWVWTQGASGERRMYLEFEAGFPIAIDGERMDGPTLIERLNEQAGALGVGRGYHLGDTVLGIKGRIAFEAPAAEVILSAHRELEKLVLTEDQRLYKDQLGEIYGQKLHRGLFHDPFLRDLEAFFASSQERVRGTCQVLLRGGRALVEGLESPYGMLAVSDARYGERPSKDADPAGAVGLARILAEPGRLHRLAGRAASEVLR